MEEIRIHK